MTQRLTSKVLVETADFEPTDPRFHVLGVFNPGASRVGDEVVLLVRVAQAVEQDKPGWLKSPRSTIVDGRCQYEIDSLEISPDDDGDHRKPLLTSGHRRLAFISHLEMIVLEPDGMNVREIRRLDALFGHNDQEMYGVEDPRITCIGDTYYITYVGVSEKMGVATFLMSTKDFESFERHGVMLPCENKDVVLVPEAVDGRYYCYHRPVGHINIRKLAILAASSPDLYCWGRHQYVFGCGTAGWHCGRIGAGTPPIRTDKGWLSIFHGVEYIGRDDVTGTYTAGGLLCALDDPGRVLAASEEPFFVPETDFETDGYVRNVVFPTGLVRDLDDPDRLLVYYGCADSRVAVTAFSCRAVLDSLTPVAPA